MTDLLLALEERMNDDAPAITFGRRTLSYRDLRIRIHSVAAGLQRHGMREGERVLFSVRPGIDAVVLALAIVKAGATVVFADPGAGETLFRARMALAEPRWVAAEPLLYTVSTGPARTFARRRGIELPDYASIVPDARFIHAGTRLPGVPRGSLSLARLERQRGFPAPVADDTDALIVFTSGTTETPKAVVHTRRTLGSGLGDIGAALALSRGQCLVTDQLMIGIPALIAGAHWVMPGYGASPGARPKDFLGLLADADAAFLTPASMSVVLDALRGRTLPRLRLVALGGAPVLHPLLRRIRAAMPNAAIRAIFGMTEVLPVAIADGIEKLKRDPADGDWLGRIASSVRACVEDDELQLSGPGLARRYLHESHELTTLATGDLVRIDGDELTMLGRKKDMLIRDRTNIYPALYEPVIAGLPGVREACIVGIPDEIGDDRVVLAVVGDDETPDLAQRVERSLPGLIDHAALPDVVVEIGELPRAGRQHKPDRSALVQHLRQCL